MTVEVEPGEYYRLIEESFSRRRGAPLLLSPRDWALMTEWRERGVPLRIVLQGIENSFDAFERRGPTARRINSLSYCRQEVLSLHELDCAVHAVEAGRPSGADPTAGAAAHVRAVARHLGRLARRVREAMTVASEARLDPLVGALASAAADLKSLRKALRTAPLDPQPIEAVLARLDRDLVDAARRALPPADLGRIEAAAEVSLGQKLDRMTPPALAATRAAAVARRLRQQCHLPRLTLFD